MFGDMNSTLAQTKRDSRAVETARALVARLFERSGKRDFAIRLWDGQTLPATDNASSFTLVLTHP